MGLCCSRRADPVETAAPAEDEPSEPGSPVTPAWHRPGARLRHGQTYFGEDGDGTSYHYYDGSTSSYRTFGSGVDFTELHEE